MMRSRAPLFPLAALALGLGLTGCLPPPSGGGADEEREPYFRRGKELAGGYDYKGALEAYEKALELNPRNAAAHFELGLLYEKDGPDHAAAIHHFQRFLRLRPQSDRAEFVSQRILYGKQELARQVSLSLAPAAQSVQKQIEDLKNENRRLKDEIERWRAYATSLSRNAAKPAPQVPLVQPPPQPAPASPPAADPAPAQARPPAASTASGPAPPARRDAPPAPVMRAHKVRPGETPSSISKRYGVTVNALLAANPGLQPTRMRAGQTINVPGR